MANQLGHFGGVMCWRILGVFIAAVCLFGCGDRVASSQRGEVWDEEVTLQTGERITVSREFRYGSAGDPSMSHGPLYYASLDFIFRGNPHHWEGRGLMPVLIQPLESGEILVASAIPYCTIWRERGRPSSGWVIEVYRSGSWVQIQLGDAEFDPASNLSGDSKRKNTKLKDDGTTGEMYRAVTEENGRINC